MGAFVLSAWCAVLLGALPLNGVEIPAGSSGQAQPASPTTIPAEEIPVSLDQVKKEIARKTTLTESASQAAAQEGVNFKVRIQGYTFDVPDFNSTLVFPKVPTMFGGTAQADLMRMMVPESVRGGALYSNGELATIMVQALASAFAVKGINAARHTVRDAIRSAEEARIHRDVLRQLLQIEENRKKRAAEARKIP